MAEDSFISIYGAKENNLKNIDVFIPKGKLTVITGLSGSGKSSLAFNVLYAESHRRYIESLSNHSGYFVPVFQKANVEKIIGLTPSVSIAQNTTNYNPRSTVGTVTEIYDYLRLLYAKVGVPHCPKHKSPVEGMSAAQIVELLLKNNHEEKLTVLLPMVQERKGEFTQLFLKWEKMGFLKARVDNKTLMLNKPIKLAPYKRHSIDLFGDTLQLVLENKTRLLEAIEQSFEFTKGQVKLAFDSRLNRTVMYSNSYSCSQCDFSVSYLEPSLFSFNHPSGFCKFCLGLGILEESNKQCTQCGGGRLNNAAMNVLIKEFNISQLSQMPLDEMEKALRRFKFQSSQRKIIERILEAIFLKIHYMKMTNTEYLFLNRSLFSLSGGEAQRIRLTTQMGSSLKGITYVLDEPSIGLHPYNHDQLLGVIKTLCKKNNTVVVVEHDLETIRSADYLIDLGPEAGTRGGGLLLQDYLKNLSKKYSIHSKKSASHKTTTLQYLFNEKNISVPQWRAPAEKLLKLKGVKKNNLKNMSVDFPLERLVGITGPSGSGKSSLVLDVLYEVIRKYSEAEALNEAWSIRKKLNRAKKAHFCQKIEGLEHIDRVFFVNQKPIGKTPRSVPATYLKILSPIRQLFASLPEAQLQGLHSSHFSFNTYHGKCQNCQGLGYVKVEMNLLPVDLVVCSSCQSRRYESHVLSVKYKEKNIADVLNMTVDEAFLFFKNHSLIVSKLSILKEVGLGYVKLGQGSHTLSGGEAQRIRLSRELGKVSSKKTLYLLDEPTTGLHIENISVLINLFQRLINKGHSIIVIEHNMDLIKCCDYVIDLGPFGGDNGGKVIAVGTPKEIASTKKSVTAPYLKKALSV